MLKIFLLICILLELVLAGRDRLLVVTVATERNDPLDRFERSLRAFGLNYKIFGIGETWKGGDLENGTGGGQKIRILKNTLRPFAANDSLIVLYTDAYDVVFNDDEDNILKKYKALGFKVLFGAEDFCWPDKNKADLYPEVSSNEKRFLNSGGFMGPVNDIVRILDQKDLLDTDDDQRYYTDIYLDKDLRKNLDIGLDNKAHIFMNLNGALDEISLYFEEDTGVYSNIQTKSTPSIYHANGPVKTIFNGMTNYLAKSWTPSSGCLHCKENLINLEGLSPSEYPKLQLSIFVSVPTPFLKRFFSRVLDLKYPRNRASIIVYSPFEIHIDETNEFLKKAREQGFFSVELMDISDVKHDLRARVEAMELCAEDSCDYVFMLDGGAHLTDPDIVLKLITSNRSIIGPKLSRRKKLWSNFWGALSKDGFYSRSDDYVEIVERVKKGIWNVPYLSDAYLVKGKFVKALSSTYQDLYKSDKFLPENSDIYASEAARKNNIFMWVDNREDFGYLINTETMSTTHLHNDLWQTFDNPMDWEETYIHPENKIWAADNKLMEDFEQPCPDVFWFPLMSEFFCKEFIEEMEHFGEWSSGSNKDSRLEGGYENVPTRDIHMRQVDWEAHWLHIMRTYVKPIQRKLFQGHEEEVNFGKYLNHCIQAMGEVELHREIQTGRATIIKATQ
ncbi:Procollagen-lysine,2-oxoglutarate 5-dioxygenase 2 [Cichlidogyrus casuarinus]|uniref:Procollagen-lysine,2-oxoglutarate 5-dioxygenase 2 n=1 Tax=Cichlidogyrus casuarinus TaxID=1844966 RepID=A0ABD2QG44_9PLAT